MSLCRTSKDLNSCPSSSSSSPLRQNLDKNQNLDKQVNSNVNKEFLPKNSYQRIPPKKILPKNPPKKFLPRKFLQKILWKNSLKISKQFKKKQKISKQFLKNS